MLPEVPVATEVTGGNVGFRFAGVVSIFMLVVSRNDEVVWELVADGGQIEEAAEGSLSITPLEQATPEMLEMVRRAEKNFLTSMREDPPPTAPVSYVRYGQVPPGYHEEAPARTLVPGRYNFTAMCAQGHASGEFDVPAA